MFENEVVLFSRVKDCRENILDDFRPYIASARVGGGVRRAQLIFHILQKKLLGEKKFGLRPYLATSDFLPRSCLGGLSTISFETARPSAQFKVPKFSPIQIILWPIFRVQTTN